MRSSEDASVDPAVAAGGEDPAGELVLGVGWPQAAGAAQAGAATGDVTPALPAGAARPDDGALSATDDGRAAADAGDANPGPDAVPGPDGDPEATLDARDGGFEPEMPSEAERGPSQSQNYSRCPGSDTRVARASGGEADPSAGGPHRHPHRRNRGSAMSS